MTAHCHQCGQPIPGGIATEGICPACLWNLATSQDEDTRTVMTPLTGMPRVEGHEILNELARGGMGVVYKARQIDPPREVALKMLLPRDEKRADLRDRFHVEVRALADLDHPGILPLYLVGDTDGCPWFTMKLAAGGTLATRLGRKRQPYGPREAAKLIAGLADAVFHAHSHGVLHRDIKPANILFDERGDPFLADFGLAKLLDSDTDLTRTMAVIGTPCYMAPEVASNGAREATTSSDIYGLGAVLYELLTGRPPFIVEGMAALVRKIVEEMPERPSTIAAHVPRDLELVCLTCLAKEPHHRYTTAQDLAEDLRRWLRGEPVAAHRTGPVARLWMWARRRPALALVSAALLSTVLISGISLTVAYFRLKHLTAEEQASRERADEQSEFLIGKFTGQLEKIGRLSLIEDACAEAEKLDRPRDAAGYKRRARLLLRWAAANWARGAASAAVPRLREVISTMEDLHARAPSADAFILAQNGRCRLAEILADTTSFSEALAQLESADAAVARPGILPLDETLRLQAEVDRTRALIWTRHRRDEPEITVTSANRAVASFRNWHAREPGDRERTLALAEALREAGKAWYHGSGEHPDPPNLEKALPLFSEGADLMRALPNRTPEERLELAYALGWMGDCLLRMEGKGPAAAAPLLEEEYALATALANRDPLNGEWQHKLANCHLSLAELNQEAGKPVEADIEWNKCRAILQKLHTEAPLVRSWALNYLTSLLRDGRRALKNNNPALALQLLEECASVAATRVAAMPDSNIERQGWLSITDDVASLLAEHDPPRALAIYQRAAAIAEKSAALPGPGQPWWQWAVLHYQRKAAASGNDTAALASWLTANLPLLEARAAAAGSRAAAAPDSIPECEIWKTLTDEIGKALEDHKDLPRALAAYRRALDLARTAAALPGQGQLWWEWTQAQYHRRVASMSRQTGALPDWMAENLSALEIRVRHLENGTPFARRDPKAVANAFLSTIQSQIAGQQPGAALSTATRALDVYLKHQAAAGPASEWAAPVIEAVKATIKDTSLTASACALAAKAAGEIYPAARRDGLEGKDRAAAATLDQLAAPPQP